MINPVRHLIVSFLFLALLGARTTPLQSQQVRYLPASEAAGYGGSVVAHVEDASAVYWNPAALALLRGAFSFVSVHDAFLTNYLAYAQFFPLYGTVGFGLGRFRPSSNLMDVGTLALARSVSEDLALGVNLDLYHLSGVTAPTLGFSLLFSPTDKSILRKPAEDPELSRKSPLRLALTVQRVPLARRHLSTQIRAGLEYRPGPGIPWVHTALQFESGKTTPSLGVGWPMGAHLSAYSGLQSFDLETLGLGVTVRLQYVQAQIVYSRARKRMLFSLGFRISEPPARLAERYYREGIQRVREGRLSAGLQDFRKYLEYRPREPRVLRFVTLLEKRFAARRARVDSLLQEGTRLEGQGWYISAALLYRKALQYDPDATRVRRRLVQITPRAKRAVQKMVELGQQKLRAGDLMAAKTQFERVLMYDPKHEVAQEGLDEVLTRAHRQAEEHYLRGLGYYDQHNLSRARQEFADALALDPQHKDAQEYLKRTERALQEVGSRVERLVEEARQLEDDGKIVEAFRKYREILKYEPEHELASARLLALRPTVSKVARQRYNQARRAFRKGELSRALSAASVSVDLDPRWQEAQMLLRKVKDAIRSRTQEWVARGEKAMADENWPEALKAFDAALRLTPQNARARRLRRQALDRIDLADLQIQGQTAFDKGAYREALNYFEQILERAPNDGLARKYAELSKKRLSEQVEEYFSRGMVFFAAENYEAAIREWDRVLTLDPHHARALEYRAKAEQRLQALKSLP